MSTPLRAADVHFKDQPAGTLEETAGGGTRFIYRSGWNSQIACALPILQREHEWGRGVHPFFQHLGPEGWLRQKQARTGHLVEGDDFGLLLRFGADCIGAVGIHPPTGIVLAPDELNPEPSVSPGRTVSGVQRKLLVVKAGTSFAPAGAEGLAPYIAKFNSENERVGSLIRNEALSLRWSAELLGKGEVNEFTTANVSVLNEPALIVTRFDRTPNGGKLRLEDFAQVLSKPSGRDFNGKYDSSYEEVADVIRRHSSRPKIDLARFFRRLIVFILVGNCDAHLKNFSLLETPNGLRLSPAYDIVNTAFYEGFDQTIALAIDGRKPHLEQITKAMLTEFGLSIGLSTRLITQAFDDLEKRVLRAAHLLKPPQGEPPDGFVHRYAEIVSRTCLRLFEA